MELKYDLFDWKIISNFLIFDFRKCSDIHEDFIAIDFTNKTIVSGIKLDMSKIDDSKKAEFKDKLRPLILCKEKNLSHIKHALDSLNNLYLIKQGLDVFNLGIILENFLSNRNILSFSELCVQHIIKSTLITYITLQEKYNIHQNIRCSNIIHFPQALNISEDFNTHDFLKRGCNLSNINTNKINVYDYLKDKRNQLYAKIDQCLDRIFLEKAILSSEITLKLDYYKEFNDENESIYSKLKIKKRELFDLGIVAYRLVTGQKLFWEGSQYLEKGLYSLEIKKNTSSEIIDFIKCLLRADHGDSSINSIKTHPFLIKNVELFTIYSQDSKTIYCSIYTEEIFTNKEDMIRIINDNISDSTIFIDEEYYEKLYKTSKFK